MNAAAPTISDEWIAERWPDEEAGEVRRRFEALMSKLGETPWRGIPRFPELMGTILAAEARLPAERIADLAQALDDLPEYHRELEWFAGKNAFGEQRVYESVYGDNGHGTGRQAICCAVGGKGFAFAPFIAAADPRTIKALLAERLDHLRLIHTLAKVPYYEEEWTGAAERADEILAAAPLLAEPGE